MRNRPKNGDRVKEIGWAYSDSQTATKFGYRKTGCYVLQSGVWPGPYADIDAASGISPLIAKGEELEGKWTPYNLGV